MADVEINHAMVSAKSDTADTSLIQPSDWNADLVVAGGTKGDIPLRDTTAGSGASWLASTTRGAVPVAQGAGSLLAYTGAPANAGEVLMAPGSAQTPAWAYPALTQSFRGLHLRTGEAGDAATTVTLLHADEIVCSNGVRRTPADNLSAVITTSGIGGLRASQSEAASTWYKIMYAYGGSGEGLYLEQAKDYYLDQSFTTATDAAQRLRTLTGTVNTKLAQSVTFATAGKLEFVDLSIYKGNAPTGSIWVTLEADAAGDPSGTPLATSVYINAANVAASEQFVRFVFRAPYSVTAAKYHLVIQGDYAESDSVSILLRGVAGGGYAGGSCRSLTLGTWGAAGFPDAWFRAYVTRNDNAVAPPSGYDTGYAQIGWVYNNSGSNFVPMAQVDRSVRHTGTAANVTATILTLTDLTLAVPPVPVSCWWNIYNTTADIAGYIADELIRYIVYFPGSVAGTDSGPWGPGRVELQHTYLKTAANTATFVPMGYEW